MDATSAFVSEIAAAIGEPARSRMLFCLMDGCARTSTELSVVAEVSPSTTSAHLARLRAARLVEVVPQGKHRYYRLAGPDVGLALESLAVITGRPGPAFLPTTPPRLRAARTCYDHAAGRIGVAIHDALLAHGWLRKGADPRDYALSPDGSDAFDQLGIDLAALRAKRRRFACACLDWSERRPHLGGALAAALLELFTRRGWMLRDLDSRSLELTLRGRQKIGSWLGLELPAEPDGSG